MTIYADTNFITYRYLAGPDTNVMQAEVAETPTCFPIIWLARMEVINSIEQSVLTGYGPAQARVSPEFAAASQQQFREDLEGCEIMRLVHVAEATLSRHFEQIALRHTAKHGFRTYDIMHVSAALALRCRSFWSFDKKASKLAKLEGLKVLS